MPEQLGPNWNGWARFSASYTEAVNEVLKKRKMKKRKIKRQKSSKPKI